MAKRTADKGASHTRLQQDTPSVEADAQAMFETRYSSARQELETIEVPINHIREIFVEAIRDSDRSAAVLIGALADDIVVEVLKREMRGLNNKLAKELLIDPGSALSTLGARTKLLQALGWIDEQIAVNLSLIRRIRNAFAHRATCRTFDDPTIVGLINSFKTTNKGLKFQEKDKRDLGQRDRFFINSIFSIANLIACSSLRATEHKSGLPLKSLNGPFHEAPSAIREMFVLASEISFFAAIHGTKTINGDDLDLWISTPEDLSKKSDHAAAISLERDKH